MENAGWEGVGMALLLFSLIVGLIKAILIGLSSILLSHFLAQKLTGTAASLFKFKNRLSGDSRYDVFSYLIAWLFIYPIIVGLVGFLVAQWNTFDMAHIMIFENQPTLYILFFGLTIWKYDDNFEKFEIISKGKIILRGLIFLLLNFILYTIINFINFLSFRDIAYFFDTGFSLNGLMSYLATAVIGLLSLFYIRKNKQALKSDLKSISNF